MPATDLYERLLRTFVRQGGREPLAQEQDGSLAAWIDPSRREQIAGLLPTGVRISQEAVTAAHRDGWPV